MLPQVEEARENELPRLMGGIRPHAVWLADAWSLPDRQLDSALWSKDGKVHAELWRPTNVGNARNDVSFEPGFSSKL